ncbi:hypothetical protein [Pseudoalteromonas sp. Of7M-16]|uniref:hypothetical protein n=1 Tax=Pseudoalteromonas sp. Of7M-16 TaxID=2917756 RepID=UPI001EF41E91|nr:hypothetical protein [Pseudoalteromonas sp. Of7M-16]MCG7551588.1 hypothetical protein [Pseudoalteromonas sp. Of7M-16]
MGIKPVKVERDENGWWVHPDLPKWDEGTCQNEIAAWFEKNRVTYFIDHFESSATEEQSNRWFEEGNCDCSDWQPTCDEDNSFLLSIHDTEYGPIGIFAVPIVA